MTSTLYKLRQKGFTLIELLVVIALLGIMAAIVIAALGTSKSRGDDAAIQSTLKNMHSQTGLYYSQYGNYGTAVPTTNCSAGIFGDTTTYGLSKLVASAQTRSASVACVSAANPGAAWAVSAQLKADATKYWCVDSTGTSKQRTQAATSTASLCGGY